MSKKLFDIKRYTTKDGEMKDVFVDVVIYLRNGQRIDLAEYGNITESDGTVYLHSDGDYTCEITKFKTTSIVSVREVLCKDE